MHVLVFVDRLMYPILSTDISVSLQMFPFYPFLMAERRCLMDLLYLEQNLTFQK